MRKLIFILTPIILILIACEKIGQNQRIIAKVDQTEIPLSEFRQRLDNLRALTPLDNYEIHQAVLQNLINEKILITEAYERGFNQTNEYRTIKKDHEINLQLKILHDKIANQRIKVLERDIRQAFVRQNEQARARILYASTPEKAALYYRQLRNGASFDELALDAFQDPRLAQTGGDLGYFSWEDMQLPFSEAAWQLKTGEISKPVLTRNGWYIIRVEDRFRPPMSETEYHQQYKKLKWVVTHRKKVKAIRDYTDKLTGDLQISFNEPVIESLMAETAPSNGDGFEDYGLSESQIIATVGGRKWTLGEFYNRAQWTSTRQRRSVKNVAGLKRFIEGLAVRETLLKEAARENIPESQEFKNQLKQKLDLYLIEKMNHEIMDSVQITEPEARACFQENQKQFVFPAQVNVREILVATENEAKNLLVKIKNGASFPELAQKYSLRKWAAKRGGELGFAAKTQFGAHGDLIFKMKKGELGGPFKNENFYSIIQVIDTKSVQPKNFEESQDEIHAMLIQEKRQAVLLQTLEAMRNHHSIEVDLQKDE